MWPALIIRSPSLKFLLLVLAQRQIFSLLNIIFSYKLKSLGSRRHVAFFVTSRIYPIFYVRSQYLDSTCLFNCFLVQKFPCSCWAIQKYCGPVRYSGIQGASLLLATVLACATYRRYNKLSIFTKKSYFLWKILLGLRVFALYEKNSVFQRKNRIFSECLNRKICENNLRKFSGRVFQRNIFTRVWLREHTRKT